MKKDTVCSPFWIFFHRLTTRPERRLYLPYEQKHVKLLKMWIFVLFLQLFFFLHTGPKEISGRFRSIRFPRSHITLQGSWKVPILSQFHSLVNSSIIQFFCKHAWQQKNGHILHLVSSIPPFKVIAHPDSTHPTWTDTTHTHICAILPISPFLSFAL